LVKLSWYEEHLLEQDNRIVQALTDVLAKMLRATIEKCAEQCEGFDSDEAEYRALRDCRIRILALLGDK
jgi:hypothetical protein